MSLPPLPLFGEVPALDRWFRSDRYYRRRMCGRRNRHTCLNRFVVARQSYDGAWSRAVQVDLPKPGASVSIPQ